MRLSSLLVLCAACGTLSGCAGKETQADIAADPQIIPRPNEVRASPGAFLLRSTTKISVQDSDDARWIGTWLADSLEQTAQLDTHVIDEGTATASDVIVLKIAALPESDGREAYRLEVTPERVTVSANDTAGLFYGAVSVWQLATASEPRNGAIEIPAMTILDAPRFAWRGLMLDVARHYLPPPFIKKMIDWMALHKLNVLHWHLTDDQGWRLEIEAYPRLTEVGAWRTPAGRAAAEDIDPATGEARQYGGFYTQDEVRDIVAYAAKRQITVVPEIEMPGHAQAAIAAYPELGAGRVKPDVSPDWGIHNYLFNVEESTFTALETILAEVLELFPGPYIHVGGDEAAKDRWIGSARVQARMRELGTEDETALQSWFVKRIERFLAAHGRKLIGWDEILEGGIAPQATVMSWRGIEGALEAASLGHDAVLTPAPTLYFDHRQGEGAHEPPGRGLVISLEDVYRFDPMPPALEEDERQHVLGVQANLWSEHIRTPKRLAYMAFPRAAALAEVAWSQPERLDWSNFVSRLVPQFDRYRSLGLPFATSAFDVRAAVKTSDLHDAVVVELTNQAGIGDILYTTDGSNVSLQSARYSGLLELPRDTGLTAATFLDGRRISRETSGNVSLMASRRASQELETCTGKIVLSLEDDAPIEGDRSVFLIDIMNPCWIWRDVDLSAVTGIRAAVGQVPFNFQIGAARDQIELAAPKTDEGELVVLANGCDGSPIAVVPLREAARNNAVTVLSRELPKVPPNVPRGRTDLCFRFTGSEIDPLWAIDWIELERAADD